MQTDAHMDVSKRVPALACSFLLLLVSLPHCGYLLPSIPFPPAPPPQFLFEWDTLLLDMWGLTQNEYGVLSTYVPRFEEMGLNANDRWEVRADREEREERNGRNQGRDVSMKHTGLFFLFLFF